MNTEAIKSYQLEKYEFTENKDLVHSASIESWDDGASNVILYGIDGNTLYESSIEKVLDDEYPEWVEPYLTLLKLL